MIIKFENPINGRYYNLIIHNSSIGKPIVTIIRGGKKKGPIVENIAFNDYSGVEELIAEKTKRRLNNEYQLVLSL